MKLKNLLIGILTLFCSTWLFGSTNIAVQTWLDLPTLYGGQANITLDGNTRIVRAGQFKASFPATTTEWLTYCTDLGATLSPGLFTQLSLSDAQTLVSWQSPSWAAGGLERAAEFYFSFRNRVDSPDKAVALQSLIWESLYDGDTSTLAAGRFRLHPNDTTPNAFAIAQQWFNSPEELVQLSGLESWWGPSTTLGQYRLGQGLLGDVIVPEPTTAILLLCGLPLIIWYDRKTNAKSSTPSDS